MVPTRYNAAPTSRRALPRWPQASRDQTTRARQAAAAPNSAVMNAGRTAEMLIDCMAAMPCGAGRRPSPSITNAEKPKNTPATVPQLSAATSVNAKSPGLVVEISWVGVVMRSCNLGWLRLSMVQMRNFVFQRLQFRVMDSIAGLLDGPRARDAFLLRSSMDPPWSIRVQDQAPLTLVAMVRGEAWVIPDGGGVRQLHPGDVAILRGSAAYTVADDPHTPPQVIIDPGQRCKTPTGEELSLMME